MIGISADFDPLHLGHVRLIDKAKEIARKSGKEVVIYLNKGYSANHAPFFSNFEVRSQMALDAGADRVIPIEGLHHRLTMSYTVPIRIAMMIEDGVTDYVDAAEVTGSMIKKYSSNFIKKQIFTGIPRSLPNRNVIRWYAVNEFLGSVLGNKMRFHFIPEYKIGSEKISGRLIRQAIMKNNLKIPDKVKEQLPPYTIRILESEIRKGNIPGERDLNIIQERLNRLSRSKLLELAYLNAEAVKQIVKNRFYRKEAQIWATFRKAGYGPVLTRLALCCVEELVSRDEVFGLIKKYESQGIIPTEQTLDKVMSRAWYVASQSDKGLSSAQADKRFKKYKLNINPKYSIEGGLYLRTFELPLIDKSLGEDIETRLYTDQEDLLSIEIRLPEKKIKSPLRLQARDATYLRLLIDSHFIPLKATIVKREKGYRVKISIGS